MPAAPIPLGLYVHLPWCITKCPYCDFNSYAANAPPYERYVDALLADFRAQYARLAPREITTVFFGGGTPSLFPVAAVERLLAGLRASCSLSDDAEITLEANPDASDRERFEGYRAAGVNRLSIGVQSFSDHLLALIGRVHSASAAHAAITAAQDAGFRRINVDLMHGLPDSSPAAALDDLRIALSYDIDHVSWYELTIEQGTAFAQHPPRLPAHDAVAGMFEGGLALLAAAGFERYEVSAYARPGTRARHNVNYWEFGDYIGIGAGAHGKLTTKGAVYRTEQRRQPAAYMKLAGTADGLGIVGPQGDATLVTEFMLNALRLVYGFSFELFETRTGLTRACLEEPLQEAKARGFVEIEGTRVVASARGYRYLTDLQLLFLS